MIASSQSHAETKKSIGKRIKMARYELEMSGAELSRRAGLGYGAISCLERGKTEPRLITAQKICAVLGITVNDLLYDK